MTIDEYVKSQNQWNIKHRMLDSNDIIAENTGGGYRFHLTDNRITNTSSSSSSGTTVPCKIDSRILGMYNAIVYANGKTFPDTDTAYLQILEIIFPMDATLEIPADTWLMATDYNVTILNDEE